MGKMRDRFVFLMLLVSVFFAVAGHVQLTASAHTVSNNPGDPAVEGPPGVDFIAVVAQVQYVNDECLLVRFHTDLYQYGQHQAYCADPHAPGIRTTLARGANQYLHVIVLEDGSVAPPIVSVELAF